MANRNLLTKDPLTHYSQALSRRLDEKHVLRLYITGATRRSLRAVANLKAICEEHLKGRYELEVIDLFQYPALAKEQQIIAAPTLLKMAPLPFQRIIGDMSNKEKVFKGLGLV